MNDKIINEYYYTDLDDRVENFEEVIDIYSSGIGVNTLSVTGNITMISGATSQSLNARNADFSCKTFSLIRETSNVTPFNITQYSSGNVVMGLNFIRGGGQLQATGSHLDVLTDMSIGTISCRAVVTGTTSTTASTARYGAYATQPHTQSARGTAFQVSVTPSGSATGIRRVFNIDSNGDTTLGTTSKIPLFDFWARNINTSGNIVPMIDDTYDLGSSSLRFNDAFVANGVTTISDPSYKNSMQKLSFSASDFVNSINVYEGKYNFSQSNRFHLFFNSHEIRDYFKNKGLDYGIYCDTDKIVSLRYQEVIPILLDNLKELNKKVKLLEEQNEIFYKRFWKWIRGIF